MKPLFEAILKYVPMRDEDADAPLQLQICSLDYSSYVGKIGIGRIRRGRLKAAQEVLVMNGPEAQPIKAKVNQVLMFEGLARVQVEEAEALCRGHAEQMADILTGRLKVVISRAA